MTTKLFFTRLIFIVALIVITFFVSCTKDAEPEKKDYTKVLTLSTENIKQYFIAAGQPQLAQMVKYSVDIYTYNYSMNFKGLPIKASGLICVPVSAGSEFPILSFQHPTITANAEAPSLAYAKLQNIPFEGIAGMGYIMVIADEIGFGASADQFHPFLIKEHNVLAVIEMLKSLKNIPDGDLSGSSPNDSLFLLGYSHGGWVTMATLQELENNYLNQWNIIAAGCGAGPYCPEQVMKYALSSETYGKPFFLSYGILSFLNDGLITNNLTDFYKEPYASLMPDLFDGNKTGAEIDAQLTQINSDLYADNFLNNYPENEYENLQNALIQNETKAWLNKTPLMLSHGQNDVYIPKTVSDSIYLNFLSLGSENVSYLVVPVTDHITAAVPSIAASIIWFQTFKR